MIETWKPIPTYPGYEASSLGRIRSIARMVQGFSARGGRPVMLSRKEHILSQNDRGAGRYRYVCLSIAGVAQKEQVHKLVLMAFVGERPDGMFGCHNNGNSLDNRPENLRWDTPLANAADVELHGNRAKGEQVKTAKLRAADVAQIHAGLGPTAAMRTLGIGRSQYYRIKNGVAWAHIGREAS